MTAHGAVIEKDTRARRVPVNNARQLSPEDVNAASSNCFEHVRETAYVSANNLLLFLSPLVAVPHLLKR